MALVLVLGVLVWVGILWGDGIDMVGVAIVGRNGAGREAPLGLATLLSPTWLARTRST